MNISENLVNAITILIQGVEVGQSKGAFDLKSASVLSHAVEIAKQNIDSFNQEQIESQNVTAEEVVSETIKNKTQKK